MKKFLVCCLVALFISMCFSQGFAANKAETFDKKMNNLTREIYKLAEDILAFNKPAFETKLTKSEQAYGILWSRVCAKDQTLVWGYARKDKKFIPVYIATSDPKFVFSNVIRAGADVKVLERFFGDSVNKLGHIEGKNIRLGPDIEATDYIPASSHIICSNGVIKEIFFAEEVDFVESSGVSCAKAKNFAMKKAKEMGFETKFLSYQ